MNLYLKGGRSALWAFPLILLLTLGLIAVGVVNAVTTTDWKEYSDNPIYDPPSGAKAYYPSVLYDANNFSGHGDAVPYKMWYGTIGGIAYATSSDGIQWSEYNKSTPLKSIAADANHPLVEYYPSGFPGSGENPSGAQMYYRIWYWDSPLIYTISAIRYAESPDGIKWYNDQPLQNGSVPMISGGDPWWNRGSYGPCDVLYNPSASNTGDNPWDYSFVMYYDGTTGGDESIGLGYSEDSIIWNGYDSNGDGKAEPVLEGSGSGWDKNYVSRCTVIFKDSLYHMWYSGGTNSMNHGIGYASSSDGINWTKDLNNPIFHKDDGEDWRIERTYCPMVIDGKMWFSGKDKQGNYTIGLAIPSTIPATVEIKPETLNLKSKGIFTAFIQLPEGYDVTNIEGNTIVCEGASAVKWNIADDTFIAKFNMSDLVGVLPADAVKLTVTGQFKDGTPFLGSDTIKVIQEGKPAPALLKFSLGQNLRNPFNPDTWIPYTLAADVDVVIRIYGSSGQIVRTLNLGHQLAGRYTTKGKAAYWDGRNETGEQVASGVYFYQIQAGKFTATKKMFIAK